MKFISIITVIIFALSGCPSDTGTGGGTINSIEDKAKTAGKTFWDCEKADIGKTVPEVGLTVLAVVTQIIAAGADNYKSKLDEIGSKYGQDTEACAVQAVLTVFTAAQGSGASTSMSPAAARASSMIAEKHWQYKK